MFNWNLYLELSVNVAATLDKYNSKEAACRSAISSAYYSVFHQAKLKAESDGYTPMNSYDHTAVPKYFLNYTDKNLKKVNTQLGRIKVFRQEADYSHSLDRDPEVMLLQTISIAKAIVSILNSDSPKQ